MHDYIYQRVLEISHYMLETRATVREAARNFGVSKSTVHKDITERLPQINSHLGRQIKKILKSIRRNAICKCEVTRQIPLPEKKREVSSILLKGNR